MKHQLVVIEFVGLPGIGKSTAAKILEESLNGSGVSIPIRVEEMRTLRRWKSLVSILRMTCIALLFFLRSPFVFARFLMFSAEVRKNTSRKRMAVLLQSVLFMIKAKKEKEGVIILEEGPLQHLWGAMVPNSVNRCKDLYRLIEKLPGKGKVIILHITGSSREASERVYRRSKLQSGAAKKEDRLQALIASRGDQIAEILAEMRDEVQVKEFESVGKSQDVAVAIEEWLRQEGYV